MLIIKINRHVNDRARPIFFLIHIFIILKEEQKEIWCKCKLKYKNNAINSMSYQNIATCLCHIHVSKALALL